MNHWSLIYRFVWIALAVLLLAGMGFMFVPLIQQDREFQRREAQLTETIEQHEQEIRQLRIKQERFQTDPDFVERIAHIRSRTIPVIRQAIHQNGYTPRCVAFVNRSLIGSRAVQFPRATLARALDVVLGDIGIPRLLNGERQRRTP